MDLELGDILGCKFVGDVTTLVVAIEADKNAGTAIIIELTTNMAVVIVNAALIVALRDVYGPYETVYSDGRIHGWDWDELYSRANTTQRNALETLRDNPNSVITNDNIITLASLLDDEDRVLCEQHVSKSC